MAVDIWYLARLRETLACDHEQLELSDGIDTVSDLLHWLSQRGEVWHQTLLDEKILVAVNHTVASMHTTISDDDEIAFFPPVTGG